MTTQLRTYSTSKTYHIIFKGIDNQNIFYEDQDREIFLKQLLITKKKFEYKVCAYCLMDNHVHLVIIIEDKFLSKAMQNLIIRYAHYFNKKYQRVGPFLQNRFKSKNIENQMYFIKACRYVHRNPKNAEICEVEDYKWSSYREYIGKEKIVDKKILLHYFNNQIEEFVEYTQKDKLSDIEEFSEYEMIVKLTDNQLAEGIKKKFKIDSISDIPIFFKDKDEPEIKTYIEEIKKIKGTNKTQVARVIRIGRRMINRIW